MRRLRYLSLPPLLLSLLIPVSAVAAPWIEAPKEFFTENASFASSKVDAADLNGDGYIDLVFANGAGFDKGDDTSDLPQQAFFNNAGVGMTDVSAAIFGGQAYNGRAVKLRDVDYDGHIDIILGTTWTTQTQLFMNDGAGNFANETATNLPQSNNSIGDIEVGDIDGDGDLDMLLADWGQESPVSQGSGGITKL
ncbi:MAG: VCBS repeat-containing protein, partial [Nannocystis sp.]